MLVVTWWSSHYPSGTSFRHLYLTDPTGITMEILKRDTVYFNTGWLNIYSYTPVTSRANNLFTKTFTGMEAGVYFLRINNTAGTGLGPTGWATLTNTTHVFWQVDGDTFTTSKQQAFMIVGLRNNGTC